MPKPKRLLSKARYAIEDAAYRISEAGRRAKAKRKIRKLDRQNNLHGESRRIVKMRPWIKRRGENKHGYSRVKIDVSGKTLTVKVRAESSAREFKVLLSPGVEGEIFTHVFYNKKENRFIFVTKDITEISGERDVELNAYSVTPNDNTIRIASSTCFLSAHRHLIPEKGISIGGAFYWPEETSKTGLNWGKTRPPEFIKGKGFGLFVDFLRDAETREHGVSKLFGQIGNDKKAKRFAERRGFRLPTKAEREQYYKIVLSSYALDGHELMVRDL